MELILFAGVHPAKKDPLQRVTLPLPFRTTIRTQCQNQILLDPQPDFLIALPPAAIQPLLDESQPHAFRDLDARTRRREITAPLHPLTMDNQGRIRLPGTLTDFFSGDRLVVVGSGHDFEIWEEDRFRVLEPELAETILPAEGREKKK